MDAPLIDLAAYGHGRKPGPWRPFGLAVANMAEGTVRRHLPRAELAGIHACLRQTFAHLVWRTKILGIPFTRHRIDDGTFGSEGRGDVLPNSLVATVLVYRDQLSERGTGLGKLVLSDLARGIEWACADSLYIDVESGQGTKLIYPAVVAGHLSS